MLVALLLVVAGAALVTGDGSADEREEPAPELTGEEAVTRFLEAWERSRTETYVMRSELRRILTDGQHLERVVVTVQALPQHLTIDGGSVTGVLDGTSVA